jgi:hypothetical protein
MQAVKRSYLALCVIVVGSLAGSAGCVKMPHQNWAPTEGLGSNQEGPNFLICRSCEDVNYNGKLEAEEIQDMNPSQLSSGEEVIFVVRNTSSWKLKVQIDLRDKQSNKSIYKSARKELAAASTWTASTTMPTYEQQTQCVAVFYVDYKPVHKAVFTVVP